MKSNGHLTKYFLIKNSVRQSCPISALLYVLASETVSCAIRSNEYIRGIPIPMSNTRDLKGLSVDSPCDNHIYFTQRLINRTRYAFFYYKINDAPHPSLSNIRLMDKIK